MKKVAFITLIAAFVFGINTPNANAAKSVELTTVELDGGHVGAHYDEASQILTLRMSVPSTANKERVLIQLFAEDGEIVYTDKVLVEERGVQVEISFEGFEVGVYKLRVLGNTIKHSDRFKKK